MIYHTPTLPPDSAEWSELTIVPLADLHIGDKRFDEKGFLDLREWILGAPNRFCVLNGDILNTGLKNSKGNVYSEAMRPRDAIRYAQQLFEPLKGRIWSAVPGNHEERMVREVDVDPTEILAGHLGCQYDEAGVVLGIRFGRGGNGKPIYYAVYHTHGSSGARRIGGKATHMEDISAGWEGIDVFITGHSHVKLAFKEARLVVDPRNGSIYQREVTHVNNSTFQGWGGYSERRGYKPSSIGPPHIILDGREKRVRVIA